MDTNAAQSALTQSDIDDLENETPEIYVTAKIPNAAPAWVVFVLPLAIGILGFRVGYSWPRSVSGDPSASIAAKQWEEQLKVAEYDHDWRTKVINACVNAGRIPFVLNGNVDCKAK